MQTITCSQEQHINSIPENASDTALMLPGGGARGAYQVGVLKAISEFSSEATGDPDHNPFPLITGTSAGAINAGILACNSCKLQNGVHKLEQFWREMRSQKIFCTDMLTVMRYALRWFGSMYLGFFGFRPPASLLNNTPLFKLLSDRFKPDGVQQAIESGALKALAVNASGYTCSSAISFFQGQPDIDQWRSNRREGMRTALTATHLLASSALPMIFPATRIGNDFFGDGGMRQTAPLSTAIHLGASRILVITTRDVQQDDPPQQQRDYPSLSEISGAIMDIIFMDNLNADIDRINRTNRMLRNMTAEQRAELGMRHIDVLSISPSQDVRKIAYRHSGETPKTLKFMLRRFGAKGDQNHIRLPSYLLFERGFCRALIDLGYQDALAQKREICTFMGWENNDE